MSRKITIYLDDADGQQDRCTGFHAERRDGTAMWITGEALEAKPTGSPHSWRQIGERARDDAFGAPAFVLPTPPAAPTVQDIDRAQREVAAAEKRIVDAAALAAAAAKKKAEAEAIIAQAEVEIAAADDMKLAAKDAQGKAIAAIQSARDAELQRVAAVQAELAAAKKDVASATAGEVVTA